MVNHLVQWKYHTDIVHKYWICWNDTGIIEKTLDLNETHSVPIVRFTAWL